MTLLQIYEEIQQHHPNIGETELAKHVNRASDYFCEMTEIYRPVFQITTVAGTRYYPIDGSIIKVLKAEFNGVHIPRLQGKPVVDDDEHTVDGGGNALTPQNNLGAPSTSNNSRFWYIDEGQGDTNEGRFMRIGVVEKSTNAVTRDDETSDYQSVSVAKKLNLYCIARPPHINNSSSKTSNSNIQMLEHAIPTQYHEAIPHRVISVLYKDPRNKDYEASMVFDQEFTKCVKMAQKFRRSNYNKTGFIKPVYF
jgi:hypothetical protein